MSQQPFFQSSCVRSTKLKPENCLTGQSDENSRGKLQNVVVNSSGQITNFGAHSNDKAQWGLGMNGNGPVQVEYISADYLPKGSLYDAATHIHVRYTYASGVVLECRTAEPSVRCIFEGTEGVLRVDNKGQNFETFPESIKRSSGSNYAEVYASNDDHQRL